MPNIYVRAGGSNAEPHACRMSSLPTEPSPISFMVLSKSNKTFLLRIYGLPYKFRYLFHQRDVL